MYTVPGKFVALLGLSESSAIAHFIFEHDGELTYDAHDTEQQKQLLFAAFKGESWETTKLLERMTGSSDLPRRISASRLDRYGPSVGGSYCCRGDDRHRAGRSRDR